MACPYGSHPLVFVPRAQGHQADLLRPRVKVCLLARAALEPIGLQHVNVLEGQGHHLKLGLDVGVSLQELARLAPEQEPREQHRPVAELRDPAALQQTAEPHAPRKEERDLREPQRPQGRLPQAQGGQHASPGRRLPSLLPALEGLVQPVKFLAELRQRGPEVLLHGDVLLPVREQKVRALAIGMRAGPGRRLSAQVLENGRELAHETRGKKLHAMLRKRPGNQVLHVLGRHALGHVIPLRPVPGLRERHQEDPTHAMAEAVAELDDLAELVIVQALAYARDQADLPASQPRDVLDRLPLQLQEPGAASERAVGLGILSVI